MTSAVPREPLEVVLTTGVRIRVPADFDAAAVARFLELLPRTRAAGGNGVRPSRDLSTRTRFEAHALSRVRVRHWTFEGRISSTAYEK
jgi:hypothetical protein